jgi:hypothetical protein
MTGSFIGFRRRLSNRSYTDVLRFYHDVEGKGRACEPLTVATVAAIRGHWLRIERELNGAAEASAFHRKCQSRHGVVVSTGQRL